MDRTDYGAYAKAYTTADERVCFAKCLSAPESRGSDVFPYIATMSPREIVKRWVDAFNRADVEALSNLYAEEAINHQMPNEPIIGKSAIKQMFAGEFAAAPEMHCIPVQIIAEGDWAVLEWKDPRNFNGCGFFEIKNGLIQTQRGIGIN